MKCKFIVGEAEKHEVEVDTGGAWFWSRPCFKVTIDGKTVVNKRKYVKTTDRYRTRIGDKEKHDLEIVVSYPGLAWGGVKIEAFVDGKLCFKGRKPLV